MFWDRSHKTSICDIGGNGLQKAWKSVTSYEKDPSVDDEKILKSESCAILEASRFGFLDLSRDEAGEEKADELDGSEDGASEC